MLFPKAPHPQFPVWIITDFPWLRCTAELNDLNAVLKVKVIYSKVYSPLKIDNAVIDIMFVNTFSFVITSVLLSTSSALA